MIGLPFPVTISASASTFLLGLFPSFGDAISLLIGHHAWASGASKLTLAHARQCRRRRPHRFYANDRRFIRRRLEGKSQERPSARGPFEHSVRRVGSALA